MEEQRNICSCDMLSKTNLMEENKGQIEEIICKIRNFIERTWEQNIIRNGNSFNDRFFFNLHKIIIGQSALLLMMSGIYDSDAAEEEMLGEILGDFNTPEDIMLEESFEYITECLHKRDIL